jgi:hypothetical protein
MEVFNVIWLEMVRVCVISITCAALYFMGYVNISPVPVMFIMLVITTIWSDKVFPSVG